MFFIYFIFFFFLDSLSSVISLSLNNSNFNLLSEFFYCVDSFSICFVILYLVLFFLAFDFFSFKILRLRFKPNKSYLYLNLRFYFMLLSKFKIFAVIFLLQKLKSWIFKIIYDFFLKSKFLLKNFPIKLKWRPLFKRWSYFGIWSKKNNSNK